MTETGGSNGLAPVLMPGQRCYAILRLQPWRNLAVSGHPLLEHHSIAKDDGTIDIVGRDGTPVPSIAFIMVFATREEAQRVAFHDSDIAQLEAVQHFVSDNGESPKTEVQKPAVSLEGKDTFVLSANLTARKPKK